jgi:ribosomal protein L1
MAKISKKLKVAYGKVDHNQTYVIAEAVKLAKDTSVAKFDATIDVAFNLNVDPRHADQQIRGAVVLPAGTGKTQKVLVLTKTKASDAEAAGYRTDKEGNVHSVIGKASFKPEDLIANYNTLLDVIKKAKPQSVKGTYIKNISISATMGPGIKITIEN